MTRRSLFKVLLLLLALLAPSFALGETQTQKPPSIFDATIESMNADELFALRERVNARLREMGAYPFVLLKQGMKGDDVTALQNRLMALGYFAGVVNGTYTLATTNAMKAFEKANGLRANGSASPEDQIALYAPGALTKPTPTPSPTPRPTATPSRSKAYPKMNFKAVGLSPEQYMGKQMSVTGIVLQAIAQEDNSWRLRVATEGKTGNVVYVTTKPLDFEPAKGDKIGCYGVFTGLYTYKTASGASITLPSLDSEITEKIL